MSPAPDADRSVVSVDPEEARAWSEVLDGGSATARERLFAIHAPLARRIAARRARQGRPGEVDHMDLQQLAYAGLLEAIDRFDPGRGTPFPAFAARRIEGSILDGLAKMSEVRGQIAYRNRIRAERVRALASQASESLGAAEALAVLSDLVVDLALGFMLDAAGLASGEDTPDPRATPYESALWTETVLRLRDALDALPQAEQKVIRYHYQQDVDFTQIAQLLGLSRGRIAQLHRSGLIHLREGLSPRSPTSGFI